MKKAFKYFIIAVLLAVPFHLDGQTLTNRQSRNMNMRLLELVEKYEMYSVAYDKATVYSFMDLFESGEVPVFNDMMELPEGEPLTVEEYVRHMSARENVEVTMKNAGHGDYEFRDGAWHSTVTFEKSLSYNDVNGVLFSSEEYYGKDYSIMLDCVYDAKKDCFRIASIDGEMVSEIKHLPARFDVIQHNTPLDDKLTVDGKLLKFNSFGQAFSPEYGIRPWNDDVRISRTVSAAADNYEMVRLDFKYTRLRAKARFSFTAGSLFNVTSPVDFKENSSSGYEAGADFGIAFPAGRTTTISLYAGIAYSISSLRLAAGGYDYSYLTSGKDGHAYTRRYSVQSMTESVHYSDIAVPVYLNFDHKIANNLLLNWSAGAKVYLNNNIDFSPFHVKASVTGDFASGGAASAEDALGDIDQDYTAFLFPGSYTKGGLDLSIIAGLGISYNIFDNRVFAYAKVSYEFGLTDVHSSDNNPVFVNDEVYPVVYTNMDGGKNVVVRSFCGSVSYRRQAIWPELGVMFKF